jgi:Domain of unknown function (DUF4111)
MASPPRDDPRIAGYLDELVDRVGARLGERLVGVWLFGSAALGDFDARRSDLDVQAVSASPLSTGERSELAQDLSHERLPCPVRGLEFVLYAREGLEGEHGPAFSLNLNTGPRMTHRASLDPEDDPRFWFVLDVAIGREHAVALAGPAAREVFPPLPRALIVASLRQALAWQHANDPSGAQVVLAACRACAWARDGRWLSKGAAAQWGREHLGVPGAVDVALARRADPTRPVVAAKDVEAVLAAAERALGATPARPG